MTEAAPSVHMGPAPFRGAGEDPWALALADNPYNVLPEARPDQPINVLLRLQARLQRRGLTAAEDSAFRVLRDLPARLTWDLFTLGTTPAVDPSNWIETRTLLACERRADAEALWASRVLARPGEPAPMHVRAVLAANQVAWLAIHARERLSDRVLAGFVGWWAALLWRDEWLWSFVEDRCRAWAEAGGSRLTPDIGDSERFLGGVEKRALEILRAAVAADDEREHIWLSLWDRERAAIRVVARACGKADAPGGWSKGLGPLALEEVGQTERMRRWLVRETAKGADLLPFSRLRDGKAVFSRTEPTHSATAATAVRYIFSGLGCVAADIWAGQGRRAVDELDALERKEGSCEAQNPEAGADEDQPLPHARDPWFGVDTEAERAQAIALRELRAEALVLRFREELSRSDMQVSDVLETARQILSLVAALGQAAQIFEAIEKQLSGRVLAFIEGRTLPHPGEVARVLGLAREVRRLLRERGAGSRSDQDIAKLLLKRSAYAWNRCKTTPPPATRQRILRDLFEAVDLAPHSVEAVQGLATVVYIVHESFEIPAEGRAVAERALLAIDSCLERGSEFGELKAWRKKIYGLIDPGAAMQEEWKEIEAIMDASGTSVSTTPTAKQQKNTTR